ncbi:DoxX family protein [Flavobacterium sp. MK4S-17]|uniref:DoxX family protein n=1 Tax=Flavobacterium sp. MK4S-17 TaxID=2543737 RepID=UPI001357B322|nr:DoxX family protein [Flavobacterium sp. MK4S-17]
MKLPVLQTLPSQTTILIRLMVGGVFLVEGFQKLFFPELWGEVRFKNLGFPAPEFFSLMVGVFEIVCSILILMGLLTRLAVIPLVLILFSAFAAAKADIFIKEGLWGLLHGSKLDWAMLLGSIFLFVKGSGKWSLDLAISQRRN